MTSSRPYFRSGLFAEGIHSSWIEAAAFDWRDATPLGNGTLGALHFGGLAHDRILLNHERYYGGAVTPPLPDVSDSLAEVRRLLDAGDFTKANDLYRNRWSAWGYEAESARYLPGPVLNWRQPVPGAFRSYRRELDFTTGIGRLDWELEGVSFRRTAFCSMADACFVFQPCETGVVPDEAVVWLAPQDPSENIDHANRHLLLQIHQETTFGPNWMASLFHGPDNPPCAVVVHWGDLKSSQVDAHTVRLSPRPGCRLLVSMLVAPASKDIHEEAARLGALAPRSDLQSRHETIHRERYGRCVLDLDVKDAALSNDELLLRAYRGDVPEALLARLANFGRYLLVASATTGTLPPNLQGIWNGNHQPPWWCVFFFNENLQMALWPALPGGLPECVTGAFDLLEERIEDFRTNAQKMFGCRGILPPLYMSPECGLKKNPQAHVQYWTGSGAWLAQVYFDFWLFTGDRNFLEQRAIPFLKEAAAFYIDFLVEGADGLLHNYPGNSPENAPLGHLDAHGGPARVCVDATMDVALVRELFGNLIQALRLVEGDGCPDLPLYESVLEKLPAYRVNEDGAIAEWIDARQQDNYHHRHLSHLYPLFPGMEITPGSGTLFDACRIAVEKRLVVGLADQTGWSLAHMSHLYSRLGKPDRALESLALMCRSIVGVNLFTAHNDLRDMGITMDYRKGSRPLVQTEANNGITSAVYEMLAYSTPDTLHVLPALPQTWNRGQLRGLRLRGGGLLDLQWDRSADWWKAEFSGSPRRIVLRKTEGQPLIIDPSTDCDGTLHSVEGSFCPSGSPLPAKSRLSPGEN